MNSVENNEAILRHQIIVCTTEEEKMEAEEKRQTDDETIAKQKREKMNQWPHGCTLFFIFARKLECFVAFSDPSHEKRPKTSFSQNQEKEGAA